MTRLQIEKKYGVTIADDSYYNPYTHKWVRQYKLYSADGCPWENGLRTLADVLRECQQWQLELLSVKQTVEYMRERDWLKR